MSGRNADKNGRRPGAATRIALRNWSVDRPSTGERHSSWRLATPYQKKCITCLTLIQEESTHEPEAINENVGRGGGS